MAISTDIYESALPSGMARIFVDNQSAWRTAVDAPGPAISDGVPLVNPTTQIVQNYVHLIKRNFSGSHLAVRLKYDAALTTPTDPQICVFGRSTSADSWAKLKTKNGSTLVALTIDVTNDLSNGTYKFTTVDQSLQVWDVLGCNEFLIGTQVAITAASGNIGLSTYEYKFFSLPT